VSSGLAIEVSFNADGFSDAQCQELFEEPAPDSGSVVPPAGGPEPPPISVGPVQPPSGDPLPAPMPGEPSTEPVCSDQPPLNECDSCAQTNCCDTPSRGRRVIWRFTLPSPASARGRNLGKKMQLGH
jgi:hypothetical protein